MTITTPTVHATNIPVHWFENGMYRRADDGALEKRCAHCRDYFPADNQFFYANRAIRDGLHSYCKACFLEWRAVHGTPHG